MFNVSLSVVALAGLFIALHVGRSFLSPEADSLWVLALALIPDRYTAHPLAWPGGELAAWTSPLTHMAVHGDTMHLVLNVASLLAFGGVMARRLGGTRFFGLTLVSGLAGALLFCVLNWGERAPMIGASGAIAGLMAAALRLMFSVIDQAPAGLAGEVIRRAPQVIRLMPLTGALTDRRLQSATLVWVGINALAAIGLATPADAGTIAWEAHIGGYMAGFVTLGLFDPGAIVANSLIVPEDDAGPTSTA